MPKNQLFQDLVAHFGGQIKTGEVLKVDQSTVSGWVTGRHGMNPLNALKAERVTGGKFKAKDLCPELASVGAA